MKRILIYLDLTLSLASQVMILFHMVVKAMNGDLCTYDEYGGVFIASLNSLNYLLIFSLLSVTCNSCLCNENIFYPFFFVATQYILLSLRPLASRPILDMGILKYKRHL